MHTSVYGLYPVMFRLVKKCRKPKEILIVIHCSFQHCSDIAMQIINYSVHVTASVQSKVVDQEFPQAGGWILLIMNKLPQLEGHLLPLYGE